MATQGTDTGMKKWAIYNASTNATSGKVFLGLDNTKTYWGTGYDASIYYNGTDLIIDPKVVGTGAVNLNGGNLTTTGTGTFGSLVLTNALTTQYGGTGQNWSAVSTGSMPYFNGYGTLSTISAATSGWVFTANGANTAPSWQAAAGGGANTALSNLASVAINTSLLPATTNSIDLGTSTKQWRDLYVQNVIATGTGTFSSISFGTTYADGIIKLYDSGLSQWGVGSFANEWRNYMSDDSADNHISWGTMSSDGLFTYTETMRLDSGAVSESLHIYGTDSIFGDTSVRFSDIVLNSSAANDTIKMGYYWDKVQASNVLLRDGTGYGFWYNPNDATFNLEVTESNLAGISVSAYEFMSWDFVNHNVAIGAGESATDYSLTFNGETNDGILTWMEDEDYFLFGDNVNLGANNLTTTGTGTFRYLNLTNPLDVAYGGTGHNWSAVSTGSMPYFSSTGTLSTISAATSGWVFTANGANTAPSWQEAAAGGITGSGAANQIAYWSGASTLTASAGLTYDGTTLTSGGGTEVFTVLSSGNVGIGDTNPSYPLVVVSTASAQFMIYYTNSSVYTSFGVNSSGNLTITPSGGLIDIGSAGLTSTATVTAGYYYVGANEGKTCGSGLVDSSTNGIVTGCAASDIRLKKDIVDITDVLGKVMKLRTVSHYWKDDYLDKNPGATKAQQIGMIAQEVQEQFPDLVAENSDGSLAIKYSMMPPILLEAIKELNLKIDDLAESGGIVNGTGTATYVQGVGNNSYLERVKTALASLGINIKNGVTHIAELATTNFTAQNASIGTADVERLQMTDESTGEIYCVSVKDGELIKVKGVCAREQAVTPPVVEETPETPVEQAPAEQAPATSTEQFTEIPQEQAPETEEIVQPAVEQETETQTQTQVPSLTIISVAPISDISVLNGTAFPSIGLPSSVTVTLDDSTTSDLAIVWDSGTDYDASTAGTYNFTGTITLTGNVVNPNNYTATVKIIVQEPPPPPPPPAEQPSAGEIIQEAASSLINGFWKFIKWALQASLQGAFNLFQ
jgi:hypothetical protein